jgi:hypothetical protein
MKNMVARHSADVNQVPTRVVLEHYPTRRSCGSQLPTPRPAAVCGMGRAAASRVAGSANPAAISQTNPGNLVSGIRNRAPGTIKLNQLRMISQYSDTMRRGPLVSRRL